MKNKIIGLMIFIFISMTCRAMADCVGTIQSITQDPDQGDIVFTTEYAFNGKVVDASEIHYDETSGNETDIAEKAHADIRNHCNVLILQIPENQAFIEQAKLDRKKELTNPLVSKLQVLVGDQYTVTQGTVVFQGKSINVKDDKENSVSDAVIVEDINSP